MGYVRTFPLNSQEQIHGEITRGPFSNPLLRKVMKEFGRDAFARSSACMEFEAFVKRVLKGRRLQTCLEIGTYHGITAVVLSQYFEQVICVSVDDDSRRLMKHDIVEFLGIKNIEFRDVMDNKHKAEVVNGLQFDFCYSDGDHTHDTQSDFDLVKRCGRVMLHEVWPLQPPVWNLVNSLPKKEVTYAEWDILAYWERPGIDLKMALANG